MKIRKILVNSKSQKLIDIKGHLGKKRAEAIIAIKRMGRMGTGAHSVGQNKSFATNNY